MLRQNYGHVVILAAHDGTVMEVGRTVGKILGFFRQKLLCVGWLPAKLFARWTRLEYVYNTYMQHLG